MSKITDKKIWWNLWGHFEFWWYLVIFCGFVILICFFPSLFTHCEKIDFSDKGEIGNVIGGTMGPFIAIIAAFLTYVAFWVQYKANKQQRNDISVERLESNMQRFIEIYRDMVNQMYLYESNIKGQPSFHFLFYEFKSIYICIFDTMEKENLSISTNIETIEYIAFEIFLSGIIKKNSESKDANNKLNQRIINTIKTNTNTIIKYRIKLIENVEDSLIENRIKYDVDNHKINGFPDSKYEKKTVEQLYKGNLPRLSSYFNHFSNILSFVAEKEIEVKNLKLQYSFSGKLEKAIKSCRTMFFSQMGVHEMALLIAYYDFWKYFNNGNFTKEEKINSRIEDYIREMRDKLYNYKDTFIWNEEKFLEADV